ncbi:MAG TPA: dienelactone hydrolase family protein [Planctomycetota bacterium]|nr:dienelactone hydrolase family protein [Planctomycetota bacterium]
MESPERSVEIDAEGLRLHGDLVSPRAPRGLILFAHGSGSSRMSPRNRSVAAALREGDLATLLLDLLSPSEEARDNAGGMVRFDVGLLASRLAAAIDWLARDSTTADLPIGLFGASTGAAAALIAAARRPNDVSCVVSRGGRPDLAGDALELVRSPTLLIIGGEDEVVIQLNEQAFGRLVCVKELAIVPGATHLFEEPGALENVASLALEWFEGHLAPRARVAGR